MSRTTTFAINLDFLYFWNLSHLWSYYPVWKGCHSLSSLRAVSRCAKMRFFLSSSKVTKMSTFAFSFRDFFYIFQSSYYATTFFIDDDILCFHSFFGKENFNLNRFNSYKVISFSMLRYSSPARSLFFKFSETAGWIAALPCSFKHRALATLHFSFKRPQCG